MNPYDETITPDEAEELHEVAEPGHRAGLWEFLAKQQISTGRWNAAYWLVVKSLHSGRIWGLRFEEGLTENQDSTYPWEDATGPLTLHRLYPDTVTTVVYVGRPGSER